MGLDTTHNAFNGAYSAFNRLRQSVARAAGGSFPPHDDDTLDGGSWYWEGDIYSKETHPGLYAFLCHSDCGGEFTPEECSLVARDLRALLPHIEGGGGHLERYGGAKGSLERFIKGCEAAAAAGEPLEFF